MVASLAPASAAQTGKLARGGVGRWRAALLWSGGADVGAGRRLLALLALVFTPPWAAVSLINRLDIMQVPASIADNVNPTRPHP